MPSPTTDRLKGLTTSVAVKAPVLCATTANITLSGTQTIDGVSVSTGDRVLVKNQTGSTDNGIYIVDSSTWSRSADCDGTRDLVLGTLVFVTTGSTENDNFDRLFDFQSTSSTSNVITPGTDTMTIAAQSGDANLAAAEASSAAAFASSASVFATNAAVSASSASEMTVRTWVVDVFADLATVVAGATARSVYAPYAITLLSGSSGIKAYVIDPSSSEGPITIDMNINSTTALSTKLTIDDTENRSDDAATPPVISITSIGTTDLLTFDVDDAGAGAEGLTIILKGTV